MSVVLCAAAATSPHQREKLTWRFITCRTNAGGLGTIGAIGMSPEGLRAECKKLRSMLQPGDAIGGTLPYGVDLLLPQVGGDARKTNKDYTGGQLEALVDVMLDEQVPLFVCAVGIPPLWVVEKLHSAGTLVMNMAGLPRHVEKALAVCSSISHQDHIYGRC